MLVGCKAITDNYQKAIDEGENSGHQIDDDFAEVSKNGDPRKEVIALGQMHFAIQTYRQE